MGLECVLINFTGLLSLLSMLLMAPMRPFAGFGNRSVAGKLSLVENNLELSFQDQQRVHYAGFMKTILGGGELLPIEFHTVCNQRYSLSSSDSFIEGKGGKE